MSKSRRLPSTADANRLLDALTKQFQIKNDAALCAALDISAASISKVRHGKLNLTAAILIRMHDAFDLSITELRALMVPQVPR